MLSFVNGGNCELESRNNLARLECRVRSSARGRSLEFSLWETRVPRRAGPKVDGRVQFAVRLTDGASAHDRHELSQIEAGCCCGRCDMLSAPRQHHGEKCPSMQCLFCDCVKSQVGEELWWSPERDQAVVAAKPSARLSAVSDEERTQQLIEGT